eukprot:2521465-Pyramimonas_sp.AAC.1
MEWVEEDVEAHGVSKRRKHADSEDAIFAGQVDRSFNGLVTSLQAAFPRASGETAATPSSFFAKASGPPPPTAPAQPAGPAPPQQPAPAQNLFGGFHAFIPVVA